MCLAIPSKVIKINEETNMALIDTMGVSREVSLDLMDEKVEIGEFVLLHVGYVMGKINEEDAMESLDLYRQMVEAMEKEEEL